MYIQYPVLSSQLKNGKFKAMSIDFNIKSEQFDKQLDAINDVYKKMSERVGTLIQKANEGVKVNIPAPSLLTTCGFEVDTEAKQESDNAQSAEQ